MSRINVWNVGKFQIKMSQCVADCGSTAYPALVTLLSALFLFNSLKCFHLCNSLNCLCLAFFFHRTISNFGPLLISSELSSFSRLSSWINQNFTTVMTGKNSSIFQLIKFLLPIYSNLFAYSMDWKMSQHY